MHDNQLRDLRFEAIAPPAGPLESTALGFSEGPSATALELDLGNGGRSPAAIVGGSDSRRRSGRLEMVGVAIPAQNEREHIERALRAVERALDDPALARARRVIVVVDDDSTDGTAELARPLIRDGEVIVGSFGSASGARRAAIDRLVEIADGLSPEHVWLATTDADSRVPPRWLAGQIQYWRDGVDAVAGMVTPIWDRAAEQGLLRQRYEAMMAALGEGPGHPHVFGANLGFTAATYVAGGGVPHVASGEDHTLWEALRANGARVVSIAGDPVETSARLSGRAPDGFASLLAGLSAGEDPALS